MDTRRALYSTFALCLLHIASYLVFGGVTAPAYFFALSSVFLAIHAAGVLVWIRGNLLILFRYFLIWVPIFATAMVWWVWEGKVYTAPFGFTYQTVETTSLVIMGGSLSAYGAAAGWFLAFLRVTSTRVLKLEEVIIKKRRILLAAGIALAWLFGMYNLWRLGGALGESRSYTEDNPEVGIGFNVGNAFQHIGIALILLALPLAKKGWQWPLAAACGSLILPILGGARADYLLPLLLLTAFGLTRILIDRRSAAARRKVASGSWTRVLYTIILILSLLGFVVAATLGAWRADPGIGFLGALAERFGGTQALFIRDDRDAPVFFMETANQMLGGFYGIVAQLEAGYSNLLMGQGYWNWVLNAPPQFLGLPRAEGVEWLTAVDSEIMSLGGIFEPSEAYANFGLAGCALVSLIISFFLATLLKGALRHASVFLLCWYLTNGLHLSRAVWYGNFSFVRIATIFLLGYLVLRLFGADYLGSRPATRSPSRA